MAFFRSFLWLVFVMGSLLMIISCGDSKQVQDETAQKNNVLTEAEKAEGWILLFDGKTFNGWHGLNREVFPSEHWLIDNGSIRRQI